MTRNYYVTLVMALLLCYGGASYGQASNYSFTSFSSAFTPVTGGTNLAGVVGDDVNANVTLPFPFLFEGISYSSAFVTSNGSVCFTTAAPTAGNARNNNMATPPLNMAPSLAPLWDDLDGSGSTNAKFEWVVTGTAPSRVITFEWSEWEWNWQAAADVISFQVKLYETTNVIEYVYRQDGNTPNNPGASIGLVGLSTFLSLQNTFASPTTSSTIAQDNLGTRPATGQVYQFTPPACSGPSGLAQSLATATTADISWTTGGASDWNVEYGAVGFVLGAGTKLQVATTSSTTVTGLTAGTCYDVYVRDSCGAGNVSGWIGPVQMCTAYPTPYFEDYDSNFPLNACSSTQPTYSYNNGWSSNAISGSYNWLTDANATCSGSGPVIDHTTGFGTFMYSESSFPASSGNQAELLSPFIDLSGVANPTIRMWYHRRGTNTAPHALEIDTGTGWITLDDTTMVGQTHTADANTDPWSELLLQLTPYQGTVARFRILASSTGCCDDPAVDDFEIFDLLSDDAKILAITNPMNGACEGETQVTLEVQNNGQDTITSIDAAYSIDGGTAVKENFSITILPFASGELVFSAVEEISAGVTYIDAWTELTGDGFLGNDSLLGDSVELAPVVDSIIYCEGFENGNGGWSWGGDFPSWQIGAPANSYISNAIGNNAAVSNLTGSYTANEDSWFLSPCFDFSEFENDPVLEFSHIYSISATWDIGWVEISDDAGATWEKLGTSQTGINWYNNVAGDFWDGTSAAGAGQWQRARHKLDGMAGEANVKIRFRLEVGGFLIGGTEGMGIDSVTIVVPPNDIFADTMSTCGDANFTLDAGGPYGDGATYLWSTSDTTSSISGVTTGSYSVTITDKKIGLSTTEDIEVIATNPPNVAFENTIDTINSKDRPVVINLSPKLDPDFDYTWSVGSQVTNLPFFVADPAELAPAPAVNTVTVTVVDDKMCTTTTNHRIFVSTFVGINTLGTSNVMYYPNPAQDQLTVELNGPQSLGNVTITIMDYQGRAIHKSQVIDGSGTVRETVDVSGFASGVYIIQLQTGTEVLNDKLIIE